MDRDLNNVRLLFDLRAIEVGVILTRATELQPISSRGPGEQASMIGKTSSGLRECSRFRVIRKITWLNTGKNCSDFGAGA